MRSSGKIIPCISAVFWVMKSSLQGALNSTAIPPTVPSTLDTRGIFMGSPIIYILLLTMSLAAFAIWAYSIFTLRLSQMMPREFLSSIREMLTQKRFDAVLNHCREEGNLAASIIASAIAARKHGPQMMITAMQSQGKRAANLLWQRISLLNEIAVAAPIVGLLGTVLGLFFAFYDSHRTADSIDSIFDVLGIAFGTTVAGLTVAILAMFFYTTLKFRVVNLLNSIECETESLVNLVDPGSTTDK